MPNPNPKRPVNCFKKGRSGNPQGSSAKSRHCARIKRLTVEAVAECGTLILENKVGELDRLEHGPEATILQHWLASLIKSSILKGDAQSFGLLMDRIVGKVPDMAHTRARARLEVEAEARERPRDDGQGE